MGSQGARNSLKLCTRFGILPLICCKHNLVFSFDLLVKFQDSEHFYVRDSESCGPLMQTSHQLGTSSQSERASGPD